MRKWHDNGASPEQLEDGIRLREPVSPAENPRTLNRDTAMTPIAPSERHGRATHRRRKDLNLTALGHVPTERQGPVTGGAPMKALVWHGKEDIRYDTVSDPQIEDPRDAIIGPRRIGSYCSDERLE